MTVGVEAICLFEVSVSSVKFITAERWSYSINVISESGFEYVLRMTYIYFIFCIAVFYIVIAKKVVWHNKYKYGVSIDLNLHKVTL